MRTLRRSALLLAATLVGCSTTGSDVETGITDVIAGRILGEVGATAWLAAETGWVVSAPDRDELACPEAELDGDDLSLRYDGCLADSGLSENGLTGAVNLTVPQGTGLFDGTYSAFGSAETLATGSLSGSASRAGDLLDADVDFTSLAWSFGEVTVIADGLFVVDADAQGAIVQVDGASWERDGAEYFVWFEDVEVPPGGFKPCAVPAGGTVTIRRGESFQATMDFSADTAESERVTVTISGRDPTTIQPCAG